MGMKKGKKGEEPGWFSCFLAAEREREVPLILKLQSYRNQFWDLYFYIASVLGEEVFFIAFMPFCSWNISRHIAFHMSYLLAISVGGGNMIKNYVQSPRPPHPTVWVNKSAPERDPGFPSTHTMTAFTIPWYLLIYYWHSLSPLSICLSVLVLAWWSISIAVSRIYNGHHYFVDVVGGIAMSGVILLVFIFLLRDAFDLLVPSQSILYPLMVSGIFAALLYLHPAGKEVNPAIAESGLVMGACAGASIGVWYRYYTQLVPFGWGFPLAPALFDDYPYTLLAARFLVGIVAVGLVREIVKELGLRTILFLFNSVSRTNPKVQQIYDKSNYKCSEVDVMLKFICYACISFTVFEIVPHLCWLLGVGHPLDLLTII